MAVRTTWLISTPSTIACKNKVDFWRSTEQADSGRRTLCFLTIGLHSGHAQLTQPELPRSRADVTISMVRCSVHIRTLSCGICIVLLDRNNVLQLQDQQAGYHQTPD